MKTNGTVVFQSDFGLVDGAVSAMFGLAINQGNFARAHDVGAGTDWHIRFRRTIGPGECPPDTVNP